jgi:hypothetical protein
MSAAWPDTEDPTSRTPVDFVLFVKRPRVGSLRDWIRAPPPGGDHALPGRRFLVNDRSNMVAPCNKCPHNYAAGEWQQSLLTSNVVFLLYLRTYKLSIGFKKKEQGTSTLAQNGHAQVHCFREPTSGCAAWIRSRTVKWDRTAGPRLRLVGFTDDGAGLAVTPDRRPWLRSRESSWDFISATVERKDRRAGGRATGRSRPKRLSALPAASTDGSPRLVLGLCVGMVKRLVFEALFARPLCPGLIRLQQLVRQRGDLARYTGLASCGTGPSPRISSACRWLDTGA